VPHMVTAGDISADGRRVLVRNYWAMYQLSLPPGRPFDEIFQQTPTAHPLWREATRLLQGEGICWTHDGRNVVTVTEAPRHATDGAFRVFIVPWRLANVTVQPTGPTSVVVSWQTADPTPSRVEVRSEAGRTVIVQDAARTTRHRLTLSNLVPGTHYRYRLRSGAILWPLSGPWPTFTTPPAVRPASQPATTMP